MAELTSPSDVRPAGSTGRDNGEATTNAKSQELSKEHRALLSLYEKRKKQLKEVHENWKKYRSFLDGDQWTSNRPEYRASPVVNVIEPTVNTVLPIMTDTEPGFEIMPSSPEDTIFAEGIGAVVPAWWSKRGMNHILVETLMDALTVDYGVMKVTWDESLEEGAGDVNIDVIDPSRIIYPEGATDFDRNCPWVIEEIYKPLGEVKAMFPDKAELIKATAKKEEYDPKTSEDKTGGTVKSQYPPDLRSPVDARESGGGHMDDNKMVKMLEFWMDDNSVEEISREIESETGDVEIKKEFRKKYPRGKLITMLPNEKVILQEVPNPYLDGKKPYVRFVDHLRPRDFRGKGEVESLIELQKIYNKAHALVQEYINYMGNPVWIIDDLSEVDPDEITNEPGLIITKTAGSEVRRESALPIPNDIIGYMNLIRQMMDQVSGIHDVTQGRRPSGITAAEAINELQEAAQTRIRLKERNLKVSLTKLGSIVVSRMLQFYSTPRFFKMGADENGIPRYLEFHIDDVNVKIGDPNDPEQEITKKVFKSQEVVYDRETRKVIRKAQVQSEPSYGIFDIRVSAGTSIPFMKERKSNLALQLFDRQAIDQQNLLDVLEWQDREKIMTRMQEQAQAQAQAAAQQQGGQVAG